MNISSPPNTDQSPPIVILAAGGTGGHIFPAAALAEALLARGIAVRLVTDARFHGYNHTGNVLTQIPVDTIRAGNISGGVLKKLLGLLGIARGTLQAMRLMRAHRPIAVVGFGGYPSLPTMLAAILTHTRTVIHEQNSVLGRVNRLIAGRVTLIATTYPETMKMPAATPRVMTGNPVRSAMAALATTPYVPPTEQGILELLVIGGSQGASVFSTVVPEAMALLSPELRAQIRLVQQCRVSECDAVQKQYDTLGMQVTLAPFFTDMPQRVAVAQLVISRAGASSVAELAVAGRPAILVPLPSAMDNHQYFNALAVEKAGAGWLMAQQEFTPAALAALLEEIFRAPERLNGCAAAMRTLGLVSAANALADAVLG